MSTVVQGIELHGRLARRDGRPANPGNYHLRFALHSDQRIKRSCWCEDHELVEVSAGGFFHVVLGLSNVIKPDYFAQGPRWASVRVVRKGDVEQEMSPRVPLIGTDVCVAHQARKVEKRLEKAEATLKDYARQPQPEELFAVLSSQQESLRCLTENRLPMVEEELDALTRRMKALDGDGKRVELLEERMDDVDGSDGDLIDLVERMDHIEGKAPELLANFGKEITTVADLDSRLLQLEQLVAQIALRLEQVCSVLEAQVAVDQAWQGEPVSSPDMGHN